MAAEGWLKFFRWAISLRPAAKSALQLDFVTHKNDAENCRETSVDFFYFFFFLVFESIRAAMVVDDAGVRGEWEKSSGRADCFCNKLKVVAAASRAGLSAVAVF